MLFLCFFEKMKYKFDLVNLIKYGDY